jgi:predicted ArsR family transcriptional regulator
VTRESPVHRGPRPGQAGQAEPWTPAQARVLRSLEDLGDPVTVTRLAEETGLHENTLRSHLEALERAGAIERRRSDVQARGRPAWLYVAVRDPERSERTGFTRAMIRALRQESGQPDRAALEAGVEWGRGLVDGHPLTGTPERHVLDLLDELGFEPEAETKDRIRLTRCPLLDVARTDSDVVCSLHLGLVRGALRAAGLPDEGVRLAPFHQDGYCRLDLASTDDIEGSGLVD